MKFVVVAQSVGILAGEVAVLALLRAVVTADGVMELQMVLQHLQGGRLERTVQALLVDFILVRRVLLLVVLVLLARLLHHPNIVVRTRVVESLLGRVELRVRILGRLLVFRHELLRLLLVVGSVNSAVRLHIGIIRRRECAVIAFMVRRHVVPLQMADDLLQRQIATGALGAEMHVALVGVGERLLRLFHVGSTRLDIVRFIVHPATAAARRVHLHVLIQQVTLRHIVGAIFALVTFVATRLVET